MADLRQLDFGRGPAVMQINGAIRPAYEWCEIFGHDPSPDGKVCVCCGGLKQEPVRAGGVTDGE